MNHLHLIENKDWHFRRVKCQAIFSLENSKEYRIDIKMSSSAVVIGAFRLNKYCNEALGYFVFSLS